ncbi:hypothetical protein AEGHOMDF_3075 [Methylobacterium soli]|nr:hypothetical protein AEGHOMDF_3075 [Methylobacterium soli]
MAQTASGTQGPALLVHGNYCGPGNNAPLAPIDALDAACARHDDCTPDGGLPSRACNLRLEREAARISRDRRQPDDLRAMAGLVSAGASMMMATSDIPPAPASIPAGLDRPDTATAPQWFGAPANLVTDEPESDE